MIIVLYYVKIQCKVFIKVEVQSLYKPYHVKRLAANHISNYLIYENVIHRFVLIVVVCS